MIQPHAPFIVIFGHGRSGTSTFRKILCTHPDTTILGEPFNLEYHKWSKSTADYNKCVMNEGIEATIRRMRQSADGMKHLKHQLPHETNRWLLSQRDHRVILMRRRNLLQTAVSIEVAKQSGVWAKDDTDNLAEAYANLPPLNIKDLKGHIERIGREMTGYCRFMEQYPHFEIVYEDFYLDMDQSAQLDVVIRAIEFVGLSPALCDWSRIKRLLDRSNKINTDYRFIKNYDEVAALGCITTGQL